MPDLAIVERDKVRIGFGRGLYGFDFAVSLPVAQYPQDARVGDLDHDGDSDLVVHSDLYGGLTLVLARPDPTLQNPTMPNLAGTWIRIADADGDGHHDLLTDGPVAFLGR